MEPRHHLEQLPGPSGLGQGQPAEMVGEVEIGVVDPHRVAQGAWNLLDPLAVAGHQAEALLDGLEQLGGSGPAGDLGPAFKDVEAGDVHRLVFGFDVQEGSISRSQALRHLPSKNTRWR